MMHTTAPSRFRFAARTLMLTALLLAGPVQAGTIRLRAAATVDGPAVLLGNVADLDGDDAGALADVELGRLGEQGGELKIALGDVRRLLDEKQVNWGLMSLSGYTQCSVYRRAEVSDPAAPVPAAPAQAVANPREPVAATGSLILEGQVIALIADMTGLSASDLRIRFAERDEQRLNQSVLNDRWELETTSISGLGRVPVTVRRYAQGRVADQFVLAADVKRRAEALVALGHIGRGDTLTAERVGVREVWLGDDRAEPLADPDLVLGQQAAAVLGEGDVIYPSHVREPELVRRGDLVTVRCLAGRLVVRTVARACEDGVRGQMIRLRNESTRETYLGSVADRREVVVMLDGTGQGGGQ